MVPITLTVSLGPALASLDPRPHPQLHFGDRVIWKVEGVKASQLELGFREFLHPFGHFLKDDTQNEIGFSVVEDRPGSYKCFMLHNHGELPWPGEPDAGVNIVVSSGSETGGGGT